MVKEEKASKIEDMLIQMAQGGQIRDKVSEKQLIDLLEGLSGTEEVNKPKITIKSRRTEEDADWDFYDQL